MTIPTPAHHLAAELAKAIPSLPTSSLPTSSLPIPIPTPPASAPDPEAATATAHRSAAAVPTDATAPEVVGVTADPVDPAVPERVLGTGGLRPGGRSPDFDRSRLGFAAARLTAGAARPSPTVPTRPTGLGTTASPGKFAQRPNPADPRTNH